MKKITKKAEKQAPAVFAYPSNDNIKAMADAVKIPIKAIKHSALLELEAITLYDAVIIKTRIPSIVSTVFYSELGLRVAALGHALGFPVSICGYAPRDKYMTIHLAVRSAHF